MQTVMNALRIPYDAKESPPVMHSNRLGVAGIHEVSRTQRFPKELVEKSWVLRDPDYCKHFTRACRARIALANTYERDLRDELAKEIYDGPLEVTDIFDTIKYMVQYSAPWHLLAIFAVKYTYS